MPARINIKQKPIIKPRDLLNFLFLREGIVIVPLYQSKEEGYKLREACKTAAFESLCERKRDPIQIRQDPNKWLG